MLCAHAGFNFDFKIVTNNNMEMDADKEHPSTRDKMEIEHGSDNSDLLLKQYELSDAQISRILDTDDNIDGLQLDPSL